jgi:hypothetical protein
LKVEQNGNVISLYQDVFSGFEQWYLLVSDVHHDSVLCNREMELSHLKEAKRRNAIIMYFGDSYDSMQGRFDPRRSMAELRPEYRRDDYFDFVVKDYADFLLPYAHQILMFGRGNHETAVLKNNQIDLLNRLAYDLNIRTGSQIKCGGYGGWVRFMFTHSEGIPSGSIKMKYFHGSGGEAPVTRGIIQTNRQAVFLPDAQIVVNGHSHQQYIVPIARERLSNKGVQYSDLQYHIRIPGYKQDYADGSGGWNVERGGVPKPIGAVWMRLSATKTKDYYMIKTDFSADICGAEMVSPVSPFDTIVPDAFAFAQDGGDF